MDEPVAAPWKAPLEVKLRIMLRNWSYSEFREILFKEAREGEDFKDASIYKRLYAYLRVLELCRRGLSYGEMNRIIRGEIGYTLPKSALSYWLRGLHAPLGRIAVFDVHTPEVGLIMGLILSDGNERRCCHCGHFHATKEELFNTDAGVLREFEDACRKLGLSVQIRPKLSRLGQEVWRLEVESTLLYLLLKRYDEFIVKAPANVQWAFMRGLMLGDGYIKDCMLTNTDPKIIDVMSKLLSMHGIRHTVRGPYPPRSSGKKPIYVVYVRNCSRNKFLRLTGLAESPPRFQLHVWNEN